MNIPRVSLYLDVRKLVDGDRGHQLKLRVKRPMIKAPDYFELTGHIYSREGYASVMTSKKPTAKQYDLRTEIKDLEAKAVSILKSLGTRYTKTAFEKQMFGLDVSDMSIDGAFARYIQSRKDLEKPLAPGTVLMYDEARDYIKGFAKKKIEVQDIDASFLRRWQKWMGQEGIGKTSVRMYSDRIKAVFNYEIAKGRLPADLYPFGKTEDDYQAPRTFGKKIAMGLPTIARIIQQPSNKGRDFWLLGYLMNGMNFADMLRIKEKHIVNEKEIRFIRQKTRSTSIEERVIVVVLHRETWELINRWATRKLDPESYIFDVLEHGISEAEERRRIKNFNRSVKYFWDKMLDEMKLPQFKVGTSRHSFTKVLDESGVNLGEVQKMLGHGSIKTTEIYRNSINFDQNIERQEVVTRKLIPGSG